MHVLTISGSPSATSRGNRIVSRIARQLADEDFAVDQLAVRELPADALLAADLHDPSIRAALARVERADAIVVATPIYKASYSGLLKAFLDLLPQDGLAGKIVLPVASGGSVAHFLALDYALRPVLAALDAERVLAPVFVADAQIHVHGDHARFDDEADGRIARGAAQLVAALNAGARAHRPDSRPNTVFAVLPAAPALS